MPLAVLAAILKSQVVRKATLLVGVAEGAVVNMVVAVEQAVGVILDMKEAQAYLVLAVVPEEMMLV